MDHAFLSNDSCINPLSFITVKVDCDLQQSLLKYAVLCNHDLSLFFLDLCKTHNCLQGLYAPGGCTSIQKVIRKLVCKFTEKGVENVSNPRI